jgi:hypothetical protein
MNRKVNGSMKNYPPVFSASYPEGIMSFSPALDDEVGLRRVTAHKTKSALRELNQFGTEG